LIHFVDFGDEQFVVLENVRRLDVDYTTVPVQCIACTLEGVCPMNGCKWFEKENEIFEDLMHSPVITLYSLFVL